MYLFVVSSFCFYSFWHLRMAFLKDNLPLSFLTAFLMFFLTYLPLINTVLLRRRGGDILEFIGWFWLAIIFWFSFTQLLFDFYNLCSFLLNKNYCLSPLLSVKAGFIILFFFMLWGILELGSIRLKRLEIFSEKIPKNENFTLALLSDLHLKNGFQKPLLRKVENLLANEKVDFLLSAGDFFDGKHNEKTAALFKQLAECPLALDKRYAVLGNHDFYSGLENAEKAHNKSGFSLLREESVQLNEYMQLYGAEDPSMHRQGKLPKITAADKDKFSIFLIHTPIRPEKTAEQGYDLMLSGHTHGGQIFPFNFLVLLAYPWQTGRLHCVNEKMRLYISPGTGFWGPPFRVLARPEVTLIKIIGNRE